MDLKELVRRFNAGKTVEAPHDITLWQCSCCGVHYATRAEAEDCEWLCRNDPE